MLPTIGSVLPCAICGQGRYSHDMIAVPKIYSTNELDEWVAALGENAIRRLQSKPPVYSCREHFDEGMACERSGVRVRPLSIPKAEREFIENFFHDHWCSDLNSKRKSNREPLTIVSCSLCSQEVHRGDMTAHAGIHVPLYQFHYNNLCEVHAHTQNSIVTERERLSCRECVDNREKAYIDSWKREAERCFPIFEFKIVPCPLENYALEWKIKEEYAQGREHILENPIARQSDELQQEKKPTGIDNFLENLVMELQKPRELTLHEMEEHVKEFDFIEDLEGDELMAGTSEQYYGVDDDDDGLESCVESDLSDWSKTLFHEDPDESDSSSTQQPLRELIYQANKHLPLAEMIKQFEEAGFDCNLQNNLENEHCEGQLDVHVLPSESVRRLDRGTRKRLDAEYEKIRRSGKSLDHGYSLVLSLRLGMSPKFLRYYFYCYRKQARVNEERQNMLRRLRKFQEMNCEAKDQDPTDKYKFTAVTRDILEEAYQKKMREDPGGKWCAITLEKLALRAMLTEKQVKCWIKRRKTSGVATPALRHIYNEEERRVLMAHFHKEQYPTPEVYKQLAHSLNLTSPQVRRFFFNQRTNIRQQEAMKAYEAELRAIPKEKCDVMESASKPTGAILAKDRMELAEQLELPYHIVTLWIEQNRKERREEHENEKRMRRLMRFGTR